MLFRSLAVGASLALAANGVLIPSGLALHEGPADKLGFPYAVNQAMNVIVECQKCLFAEEVGDVMVWKSGVKNVLVYRFDVGPQRDRLALGGVQLYPPVYGEPAPIYVQQLPAKNGFEFSQSHPDRQGLRVTQMEFYFNNAETISEDGNEILTMHLEIFGVANKLIGPHVIGIKVLKDTAGNLHLLATKVLTDPTAIAADEAKQCASWPMVCKFRQFIAEKMAMLRQSMKKPGKGGCQKSNPAADRIDWRPHHRPGRPGRPHHPEEPHHKPHHPPHNRPHHHHEHHGHHRHHHHHHSTIHRVLHIFVRVVVTFVVPILIGIAAGVATYMAGMLIGMIVAFIWVKIRGERPSQYESVAQFDDDEADEDASMVKQVYFDEPVEVEGEAPPVYQEKEVVN